MTFKFELTQDMVNVISSALGEMPFKLAMPVVAEMQKQINDQQAKAAENVVAIPAKPDAVEAEPVANGAAS